MDLEEQLKREMELNADLEAQIKTEEEETHPGKQRSIAELQETLESLGAANLQLELDYTATEEHLQNQGMTRAEADGLNAETADLISKARSEAALLQSQQEKNRETEREVVKEREEVRAKVEANNALLRKNKLQKKKNQRQEDQKEFDESNQGGGKKYQRGYDIAVVIEEDAIDLAEMDVASASASISFDDSFVMQERPERDIRVQIVDIHGSKRKNWLELEFDNDVKPFIDDLK